MKHLSIEINDDLKDHAREELSKCKTKCKIISVNRMTL